MDALDNAYETPEQRRRAAMYVPPATAWILLAGENIHQFCRDDYKRKDDRGFFMARWMDWKQKFGTIAANAKLQDGVRDAASRAFNEMAKIEQWA